MNLPVLKTKFPFFFIISILVFAACTKIITTDIGGGLIPPVDGVNTKEFWMDVTTKNIKDTPNSVAHDDNHALGYINDPLFGVTKATINLQLKPESFPFYIPVNTKNDSLIAVDSLVMVLSYRSAYGDTAQDLALRVFELNQDETPVDGNPLRVDTIYPTDYNLDHGLELTENGMPHTVHISDLPDSVHPMFEAATNQLRIRLNASYGLHLLRDLDTNYAYKADSNFNKTIWGYQVVPEAVGNSLLKINLADTNTKMAIYFRYKVRDSIGKIDTAVRWFRSNSYNCGSSNYITHTRPTGVGQAGRYIATADVSDSLIFIDAAPGIYASIKIPGLKLDTMTNKIIHRAELVMEQVPDVTSNGDTYFGTDNLFLTPFNQDSGRRFALPNTFSFTGGYLSSLYLYGCYPVKKTDDNTGRETNYYSFDLSRYLQGIITRKEKYFDLILYAPFKDYVYVNETLNLQYPIAPLTSPLNDPAFGRVRLGGGNNTRYKMRFHVVYSDLK